ncbi:MAG: glycosyltransferase [Prevotellaceae bacterium]|jgi:hypothetical protein|nr:glycosyltransferase [Prevotellaceae bacterium]
MNILYLMHIDWNWIKQRPQFIAEMIEKKSNHNLTVMYRVGYQRKKMVHNDYFLTNKPVRIPRLPYSMNILILRINIIIESLFLKRKIRKSDVIYVTHPTFFPSIKHIQSKKIIYDCMDDVLGFPQSTMMRKLNNAYEKKLIKKADLTIFSAKFLQETVAQRVIFPFRSVVINNAINIPQREISHSVSLENIFHISKKRIISYIGTIAEWFDYELLVRIANKNKSLLFYIFGPTSIKFPPNENIIFWGPQSHENIFYIMNKSDALIMPFQLNNLIRSVNPVKLYEYIYSGKPVISVRYEETEVFKDYVYLYDAGNIEDCLNIFATLEKKGYSAKASFKESTMFALSNTWEKRVIQLLNYICLNTK